MEQMKGNGPRGGNAETGRKGSKKFGGLSTGLPEPIMTIYEPDTQRMLDKLRFGPGTLLHRQASSEKAKNIETRVDVLNELGRLLSARLRSRLHSSELSPHGLLVSFELLISDIGRGVDSFTGQPIQSPLVGAPDLRLHFPELADAVCKPEFAREAKQGFTTLAYQINNKPITINTA